MISLSSIVKANLLTYLPPRPVESVRSGSNGCGESGTDAAGLEELAELAELAEIARNSVSEAKEKKEIILEQAIRKAKQIESEAQLKADALMESAVKSSREIMSDAEKKGYEEGYLRGLVDGANASEAAAEEGLHELKALIDLFKTGQREALERNEEDIIEIAFELAKKVMKQHVQTDENAVQKMLEEIISENEGSYKIYFSEYQKTLDIHIDKAIVKKMKNLNKDARLIMIKEEDLIMSENEGGIVDMSIPVQLEQLKKAVDRAY